MVGKREFAEIATYMGDGRTFGEEEHICRRAASEASKKTTYLGEQDACRKKRTPSEIPGPVKSKGLVWVFISQSKWDKARKYVKD